MIESTREYQRMYHRQRRMDFKAQGRCLRCGWETDDGANYCPECKAKINKTAREWRQMNISLGLCGRCGKRPPREGFALCAECAEIVRQNTARRRAMKKGMSDGANPDGYSVDSGIVGGGSGS